MKDQLPTLNVSQGTPEFAKTWLSTTGGVTIQVVDIQQLQNSNNTTILIWEDDLESENYYEKLKSIINDGRISKMVVMMWHQWGILKEIHHRLIENWAKVIDVEVWMLFHMVNGYGYNCKNKQFNVYEHFVGNHYNLLLSDFLKKNKKNTMDFYYAVVPKDQFRKSVTAHLMNSGVLNNSIVTGNSSQCLYNIADTIRDQIKEKYGNQEIFQALSSFGNGLPNFKAYEKIFCEITVESHNDEAQSEFIFSEKTWRPIAFDIPVVYLACKSQANKFIEMGYELHNHIFYDKWHSDLSLEEKLHHLVEYLEQIKGDAKIRESLVKVSHRNHKWFWENRKLEYYRQTTESFSNLLGGDNLIKRVYDCLNK